MTHHMIVAVLQIALCGFVLAAVRIGLWEHHR